ncbi:hypothetical protein HELRODRAFT_170551 [Helobdella robusta]|uniref:Rho-GAP domain-containing protein n=1 Tax=Helobdella robusta TaxID=6412 RepID=T1F366_HELRO|nr:hypothetical protein HELRODRAFT_170551 [Helobdella robusta]ESO07236.1 hypothetical protein HELRODRAFT_170551 [Helobdella robusta]
MPNNASMLNSLAHVIHLLPPPHYRTAKALFLHLNFMSLKSSLTCMDSRNLSIVWAPNILNSNFEVMKCENMLVISNQQAAIVECIISNAQFIFKEFSSSDLSDVSQSPTLQPKHQRQQQQKQRQQQQQKHLHPPNSPAKLISLEEAQKLFGGCVVDEANPRRCGPTANFRHRASVDGVEGDAVFTDLGVTGNIHAVIDPPKRISKMKGFKSFQDLSSKIVPVEDKCGLYSSIDEVTKHPVYHSFEENLNYGDAGNENDDDNDDGDGKSDFVPLESNKKASKSRNSNSKMMMMPKKFSESDSYLVEDFHANASEKAPPATTTVVTTAKTNVRSSSIKTALKPTILAATTTTPATTTTAAATSKFGRLNSVKNLFSKSSHTADSTSKQPQKLQQQPQRQQQQQLVENIKVPEKTGKDLVRNSKFAVEDIRARRMNLVSRPNTQMFFNEPSSQAGESCAAASPATKQQRSSLEQLDPLQVDDQQQPQSQQQQFSQQIPLQQQKLQQHYQNIVRLQQQQQPNQPAPPQQEQQLPQTSQQTTPPAAIMTTFKPDATTSNDKFQVKVSTANQQPTATLSKLSTTTTKETSDDANLTTKPKFQPPRKLTDESLVDKKYLNGNTAQQLQQQQQSKLSRQLPTERNKTFSPSSAMKPTVSSSLKQKPLINPCSSSSTTQDPSKKRFSHCSSPTTTNLSPTSLSTAFFPATFETTSSSTVLATKLQLPCDVIESSLKKMEMFLSGGEEEEEEEERRNNQLASSLTASSFRGSVDGDGVGEATSKTAAQQTGGSTVVRDVFKVIPANSLRCKSPQKLAQTTKTSKMRTSAPWRVDVSHQNEGADAAGVTLVAINKPSTPSFLSKNQPADVQSKQTIMEELIKWKENKMNSNQADDNSSKNFATHNASSVSSKDDISSKVGPYKPSAVDGIYGSSLFQSGAYNISTGSSAVDVADVGSPIKNKNTSRVYAVAVDNIASIGSNLQVNLFKNSGIVGLSGREERGNDLVKQLRTDRGRVNPIQQSNSRSAHYEFVRPKTIMYNQNNCELEELLYSPSYNVSGHSNEMSASAEDFEKVHFVENINNNFNPEFDQLNRNNNNNSKGNIAFQSNSQHDYDNVFLGCNNDFDDSTDIIRSINNCKYNRRARDDTSIQFTNLHKNNYNNILNDNPKNPVRNKANNVITFTSSNNSLFDATNHAKHFAHQQNACNRNNNGNNAYHHINTNQSSYNQTDSRMVSKEGSLTSKSFSNDDILALKDDGQLVLPYNNYHQQQQFNQQSRHQQQQQQQHSRSVGMQPKPVHHNHGSDPIGRGTSSVVPYSFLGSNTDKRQNRISSVFVQPINPPIKSYNQNNNNNFVNSNVNINNSSYRIDNNFNRFAMQNSGKFLSQSYNGRQASFYDKDDVDGQIYFTDDDRYNNNYYYNNNSFNNINNINNNINNSNVNYINTNNNRYNHNIINYNISDDNNNNLNNNNNNYDGKVSKYVTIVNVESDSSVHGGGCDHVRITNPSLI